MHQYYRKRMAHGITTGEYRFEFLSLLLLVLCFFVPLSYYQTVLDPCLEGC